MGDGGWGVGWEAVEALRLVELLSGLLEHGFVISGSREGRGGVLL